MRTADALFREYEAFHKDPRNKLTHYIGITMIVLAIASLLSLVKLAPTSAGWIDLSIPVISLVVAYYGVLDVALGIGSLLVLNGLAWAGRQLDWRIAISLFVIGWVFQFIGHAFEGKRPAFTRNAVHLLVGPLWILSHFYEVVGLRRKPSLT